MNKRNSNTRGFTIIEVVLVLAIAALIMLMVFIAFPALQRSQRDTARKQDQSAIASAISSYESNNGGALPSTTNTTFQTTFVQPYLSKLDRISSVTVASSWPSAGQMPTPDQALVVEGYDCSGSPSATSKTAAVIIGVEAGGTTTTGSNPTACIVA